MPDSGTVIQPSPGSALLSTGGFASASTLFTAVVALGTAGWAIAQPEARELLWPALALAAWAIALKSGQLRWILASGAACAAVFALCILQTASGTGPRVDSAVAVIALFAALATGGWVRGSPGPPLAAVAGCLYAAVLLLAEGQPAVGDPETALVPLFALALATTIAATADWRALPAPASVAIWLGLGVLAASAAGVAAGLPLLAGYLPHQRMVTPEGQLALSLLLLAALAAQAGRRGVAAALALPAVAMTVLVLATRGSSAPPEALPAQFAFGWWLGHRLQPAAAFALLVAAMGTLAAGQGERGGLLAGRWFLGVMLFMCTTLLLVGALLGLPQALDPAASPPAAIPAILAMMSLSAWLLLGGPRSRNARSLWLPLLAGLAVLAGTVQMARLVQDERIGNERREATIAVESAELAVLQAIQSRTGALRRFAERQLAVPAEDRGALFKVEAQQALGAGVGMESVALLDAGLTVLQVEALRDAPKFSGLAPTLDARYAAAFARAEQTGRTTVIGPLQSQHAASDAILLIEPGPFDAGRRGFVSATFGFAKVFELALASVAPGHAIILEHNGRTLLRRGHARAGHAWESAPARNFELLDARWTVRALPLAIGTADSLSGMRVERLVALAGILLAALVALALRLAALARERAESAETAHANLTVVVAERDHAGAALARSEQTAQRLLEGMSEGVLRLGEGLRIEYANPRARLMLQELDPEPLGRRLPELFPKFAGSAFEQGMRDAIEHQQPVVLDAYAEALGRWLAGRIYPQDGGLVVILADVSELRSAEQFEREQRALLQAIASGEPLANCIARAIRFFESRYKGAVAGVLEVDPESRCVRRAIAPSLPAAACAEWIGVELTPTLCSCGPALHGGQRVVVEDVERSPWWEGYRDGVRALGLRACWSQPVWSADGCVIGTFAVYYPEARGPTADEIIGIESIAALVGIALERERSARRIEESRQRFRSLFERSADAVLACDPGGRITDLNHNAATTLGRARDDLLGRPFADLLDASHAAADRVRFAAALRGEAQTCETRVAAADGSTRSAQLSLVPIEVDGRIVGVFGIVQDVSEARRLAARLDEALQEVRARNQELKDFAFVASHDLQEPLRKVQAFSDRVIERYAGQLDAQGTDWLRRIDAAAHRMQVLIDDLLAYSRVTSQGEPFAPVDLALVIRDVVSDLELRIEHTGGSVEVGEMTVLDGDRTQLRQLLQNLIANALKFRAPERAPRITVAASPAPDDAGMVLLVVEDNGIGFDPVYAERIFAPFQRLHGREEYEGTGIGLAIVRRIVERHRGRITAEGRPGVGTRFLVWLPRRAALGLG